MSLNIEKKSIDSLQPDYEPVYTIGITSKLTNTSVHALRMYERKGVLIPYVTKTNRRLFSKSDIDRIKCIRKHLDEDGLNIAGIKALLAMVPCWLIKPCSKSSQKECDAFTNTLIPCWEADHKAPECAGEDCRSCNVYMMGSQCRDVKTLCREVYSKET